MRILFLTAPHMDFLADEVLYGLRLLLGPEVVDYPRKEILYASSRGKVDPAMVWAGGSTAFLLDEVAVDRDDVAAKVRAGHFDWVVNGNCWRIAAEPHARMAVLDGEDHGRIHRDYWGSVPLYYKRELLRRIPYVKPIQLSLPDALAPASSAPKTGRVHASFTVYPGLRSDVAEYYPPRHFDNWKEYISDIERSSFAVSPKGAGYDCQRHYEILGRAALCIYIDRHAPAHLRSAFVDGRNAIVFRTAPELRARIETCTDSDGLINRGRDDLMRNHLSSCRAKALLSDMTRVGISGDPYRAFRRLSSGAAKSALDLLRKARGTTAA